MKKSVLTIAGLVMLFALLSGCGQQSQSDSPTDPGTPTEEQTDVTPVPTEDDSTQDNHPGEILYNGMPILGFMDLPYEDAVEILGEPVNADDINNIDEYPGWGIFAEYSDMTLFFPVATNELANFIVDNPKAFDVDGVSMDKTRDELIEIFGNPEHEGEIEPYDGHQMSFFVGDYAFWFTLPDQNGRAARLEIWDTTNEHAGYGV